jgi:hypothetical protein
VRAAIVCTVAVALLFVAFARVREWRQAEAEARMCPLVQTNVKLLRRGIAPNHEFWVDAERSRKTTVKEHLVELGARCKGGKVIGPDGTELYFYQLTGSARRAMKEDDEIKALEQQGFRVIRMWPEDWRFW